MNNAKPKKFEKSPHCSNKQDNKKIIFYVIGGIFLAIILMDIGWVFLLNIRWFFRH